MRRTILVMAAALVMLIPASVSAAGRRFVGGHVFVGGGYWGPGPYYWGPAYYGYPNTGEVKLDTKVKDAQVFINGAYAGTTQEDKKMHLRPGSYDFEIREGGRTQFAEKVYVAAGKTLHLRPEL